jgi:hypothetical protein
LFHGPGGEQRPDGVLIYQVNPNERQPVRVPVRPVAFDVASLPLIKFPKALDQASAPKELPKSEGASGLRIEPVGGWAAAGSGRAQAVYVIVDAPMGRLQIGGNFDERNHNSDRVYRTCGEQYFTQPVLLPARWTTLNRNSKGEAVLKISDGWFEAKACEASLVRSVEVRPKALLGGMAFAFRLACEPEPKKPCPPGEQVVVLAPALSSGEAASVTGDAVATHGNYTQVLLPLRRGNAASFVGEVQQHQLTAWFASTTNETSPGSAVFGIEISHAVSDDAPQAIAYATVVKR